MDMNETNEQTAADKTDQTAPEIEPQPAAEETCSKKVYDELYDRFLRLGAEFENFRKRSEREKRDYQAYAAEKLMTELLPVLDHLELALRHAHVDAACPSLIEGVGLVAKQFLAVLERFGVKPVDALGRPFDPQCHEAIASIESDAHPEHTVIEEHQRGYFIANRVLRPSRVAVSTKPKPGTPDADV